MTNIQREFEDRAGDVSGHPLSTRRLLGLLVGFCLGKKHLTELGVSHPVTTYAFLHALELNGGGRLVSVDNDPAYHKMIDKASEYARESGIDFEFVLESTGEWTPEKTDFLYIDDDHAVPHLLYELENFSKAVNEGGLIAIHDTQEPCNLSSHVHEWLKTEEGQKWKVKVEYEFSCGLIVLERNKS